MTYLRKRAPGDQPTTWLSVGVRGEKAAKIVADAKACANILGVTFGSLVMDALAEYMAETYLKARRESREAQGRDV